jgi:hypothetical protein
MECLEVDVIIADVSVWWKHLDEQIQHEQTPACKLKAPKKNKFQYQRDGREKRDMRKKERSRADWSLKLCGWNIWWKRMERVVVKSTVRMDKTSCSAQSAKERFIRSLKNGSILSPTSRKVQMDGKLTEGNANMRGGKLNQNDDCKTMLEVGENSRKLSKSPKFSSVINFWREKSENTGPICEHSTIKPITYTNNQIVSARDNPSKLPTSPYYPGRTKNVNFGGKSNPGDLATEEIS